MDSNAQTLATYSEHFDQYIAGTVQVTSGFQKDWLDSLLRPYAPTASILEIGSAFGRDAAYMVSQGYTNVLTSDAFREAVTLLAQKGFRTRQLNILQDTLPGTYDLIIASAVFLHFTAPELDAVLKKLRVALAPGGRLGFSVKQGTGEEWTDAKMGAPRFFHYWQADILREAVEAAGYSVLDLRHTEDRKWLHLTCQPDNG